MGNPFSTILAQLQLTSDAQGSGNRYSYVFALLKLGDAWHTATGTSWQSTSLTAADECLYRLRTLGLGPTFAYREIETYLQEAAR